MREVLVSGHHTWAGKSGSLEAGNEQRTQLQGVDGRYKGCAGSRVGSDNARWMHSASVSF